MNLDMVRGDTRSFTITVTLPDGSPCNLTGATLWFSVRKTWASPTYLFQKKTGGSGIIVPDPPAGVGIVQLDHSDTANLPPEEQHLVWDVQLKTAAGQIFTLNKGPFVVAADVTVEVN